MTLPRVNVGCGATPTPGWINLDNSLTVRLAGLPLAGSVLRRMGPRGAFYDAVRRDGIRWADAGRLPLADASIEVVYSSHMFEHLDRREAQRFLDEVKRVLRPGGTLRLVVPSLQHLVDGYARDRDADAFVAGLHMYVERPRGWIDQARFLMQFRRAHAWMYDERSLRATLEAAGFRDVIALPPGESRIPEPGPLDLRERADESIYLEALH
jgi:SAM-dependent methyltransferase